MTDLTPCIPCANTGFSDKVKRGMWTMEPRDKICPLCAGRGWVARPKSRRGFAVMDPEKRRAIASLGGSSVPNHKRSFTTVPGLAKSAGTKGGSNVPNEKRTFAANRELAKRAGRIGGQAKRTSGVDASNGR